VLFPSDQYQLLMAQWVVPSAPVGAYTAGQVYYTFPGLQSDSTVNQPVLSYGYSGSYWQISAWACDSSGSGGTCHHGPLRTVATGDTIFGKVASTNCQAGVCDWMIQVFDFRTAEESTWWAVDDPGDYWTAVGGAVEAQGLTSCSQFPAQGVFYFSILLFDQYGQRSPDWIGTVLPNYTPQCGFVVTFTSSSVNLYHSVQPPPTLDNWIHADPPHYTAEPSGGYPPYTYLWEVCAIDCTGGERAPTARGAHPNTVVHGWQFLSREQQVHWPTSQWNLRSTVTDFQAQQAEALYHVP
jgi:hypothetical protein